MPLCEHHRNKVGANKDLCPAHYAEAQRQGYLQESPKAGPR